MGILNRAYDIEGVLATRIQYKITRLHVIVTGLVKIGFALFAPQNHFEDMQLESWYTSQGCRSFW